MRFLPLVLVGVLAAIALPAAADAPLHPAVWLRDEDGDMVVSTGKPVSPMMTCGECHETDYIASHSYHVSVGFDERAAMRRIERTTSKGFAVLQLSLEGTCAKLRVVTGCEGFVYRDRSVGMELRQALGLLGKHEELIRRLGSGADAGGA